MGMKQAQTLVMDVINVFLCDTEQDSWRVVANTINCEFCLCQRVFETLFHLTYGIGGTLVLYCVRYPVV